MDGWANFEMCNTDVPHGRSRRNVVLITERLLEKPGSSFSVAVGHAGRQAATRLFGNPETTVSGLLRGHFQRARMRAEAYPLVLVAQDTTTVDYSSHGATSGLGPVGSSKNASGLLAHSAHALSPTGLPLGVVHLEIWARKPEEKGSAKDRRKKPIEEKESFKWIKGLRGIEKSLAHHLSAGRRILIIQDREADIYGFMIEPRHEGTDLLIRAAHPRRVEVAAQDEKANLVEQDEKTYLMESVSKAPVIGYLVVKVPRKGKIAERLATLELRVQVVRILPPLHGEHTQSQSPTITVVQASEKPQNEEEDCISWTLLTTLPVNDAATASKIVEYYTRRWGIERLHYTLKSGLQIERLQFDDAHSLSNALAIYWIVAWRIMYITHVAREDPTSPAGGMLEQDELTVLALKEGKSVKTAQEAIVAIAKLAGYRPTPKGGPPGVKSLWIGIQRLEAMVEGWRLASQSIKA